MRQVTSDKKQHYSSDSKLRSETFHFPLFYIMYHVFSTIYLWLNNRTKTRVVNTPNYWVSTTLHPFSTICFCLCSLFSAYFTQTLLGILQAGFHSFSVFYSTISRRSWYCRYHILSDLFDHRHFSTPPACLLHVIKHTHLQSHRRRSQMSWMAHSFTCRLSVFSLLMLVSIAINVFGSNRTH